MLNARRYCKNGSLGRVLGDIFLVLRKRNTDTENFTAVKRKTRAQFSL